MKSNLIAPLVTILFLILPIAFFLYGGIWFLFSEAKTQMSRKTRLWTYAGFGLVLTAAFLWLVYGYSFGTPHWYANERLMYVTSSGLCVFSFVAARYSKGRAAAAIVIGGLVVALNWIGTVFAD